MIATDPVGPYVEGTESWELYQARLEQHFIANDVKEDAKKRALLLSTCGKKTFHLVSNLLAPAKPADTPYKDICSKLKDHFDPVESEIVQRFKFYRRFRQREETVAEFLAALRDCARGCEFGSSLDIMLRDRIVLGINEDSIQRRLLSETNLTLEKALKIAQAQEIAMKGCLLVGTVPTEESAPKEKVYAVKQQRRPVRRCFRCLSERHLAATCPFASKKCFSCSRVGHTSAACRSQGNKAMPREAFEVRTEEPGYEEEVHSLNKVGSCSQQRVPPITVTAVLNGVPLLMEVDTGASASMISAATYKSALGSHPPLQPTNVQLRTYSGENIRVDGEIQVEIAVSNGEAKSLKLLVVGGNGSSLMGRDWLKELELDWREVKTVAQRDDLQALLKRFSGVFSSDLGTFTGPPVTLNVKENACPKFFKARNVPFAIKGKVEEQLDREIQQGILRPVEFSDYASPVVPVMKPDGSVRICADFKMTVNPNLHTDKYPLPRIEELFAKLTGGVRFSTLDLSQAYKQLPLEPASQKLCTINTHKGLLQYTRLPFGISSAVGIFQRLMDSLLQGIPGTACFLDDIIITGETDASHLQSLEKVLRKLDECGLKCKKEKCQFMLDSVSYLGHKIDAEGLHPLEEKVMAITRIPAPKNVTQLRSYLGMLNYYSKFFSDISHVLAPLYFLLRKETPWMWGIEQKKAFEKSKELLTSLPVLVHFDGGKDLFLECDASPYGLGAVIMHCIDGFYRPIAYASRALHDAESKYSQLEKEALAVIFGVRKFHSYLFGRQFTLVSDHKPLLGLLAEERPVPVLAAGRIQRWALELSNYDYKMIHRSGVSIQRADALSRLPLADQPKSVPVPAELVHLMEVLDDGPVTASQIRRWTRTDIQLSQVLRYVENGWPSQVDGSLRAYSARASELGVQDGCLLWGNRVVVPSAGREAVLKVLHQSHPGASRMKALARSHFWWPGLDSEVEELSKCCVQCQEMLQSPPAFPLQPWAWPDKPWSRVHIDYAGPVDGKMLLVIVDAHSKWLDVHITPTATSLATIQKLRLSFSTHGLPDVLVSDNGPNLVSSEMEEFLRGNGIEHIRTAPYHPSSNGLAERAVKTLKHSLSKQGKGATLEVRLARFLLSYRVTPHATTGIPPCELLMGRKLRTLLDRLHPSVASKVFSKQHQQKRHHDSRARFRGIAAGDKVLARDFARGGLWKQGRVERQFGVSSFECRFEEDGRLVRRHADQLRRLVDGGSARRERSEWSPSSRATQRFEPREESLQPEEAGGSLRQRDTSAPRRCANGVEGEGESRETHRESEHLQSSPTRLKGRAELPGEAVEAEVALPRRSSRPRVKPDRLVYS